jgi:hypothetical protein
VAVSSRLLFITSWSGPVSSTIFAEAVKIAQAEFDKPQPDVR